MEIIVVDKAQQIAGELFQNGFGSPIPDFGRHYVALEEAGNFGVNILGYCHKTIANNYELMGGLVVNPLFRARGVARAMMVHLLSDLAATSAALFTYTGHPISRKIVLDLGMRVVGPDELLVKWRENKKPTEQETLIDRVRSLGPF